MTRNATLTEPTTAPPTGAGGTPYAEALQCLGDANVPFAVLRDAPASFAMLHDLDILVDVHEHVDLDE